MRSWFARARPGRHIYAPATDVVSEVAPQGFHHRAADDDGNPLWPDDPDEVPAWRLERELWAAIHGISLPTYRTRRQMEDAIKAQDLAEAGFEPMAPQGPFNPDEAAVRFLAYLQSHGVRQEYSAAELTEVYAEYCSTQAIVPSPIDFVKAALALLPAVTKKKVDRRIDGRRQRVVCWVIEPKLAPEILTTPAILVPLDPIRLAA